MCIHIQQLLAYKNQHGFSGRRDFRGAVVDTFRAGGFDFHGEFVIAKNPQTMAQKLNLLSLQFKSGYARDANFLAPAVNDYVLIFRKPGNTEFPVRSLIHETNPGGWVPTDEWVRDAHGTWTDILEIDVLDGFRSIREGQEKHVCPLQLSLIRRLVRLYTNPISIQPNVTVLDPFMGIGSVAHICLRGGCVDGPLEEPRNVIGFELKESYHAASLEYTAEAMKSLVAKDKSNQPTLFDLDAPTGSQTDLSDWDVQREDSPPTESLTRPA